MKFWCNKFTVWNWKSLDFILFHYWCGLVFYSYPGTSPPRPPLRSAPQTKWILFLYMYRRRKRSCWLVVDDASWSFGRLVGLYIGLVCYSFYSCFLMCILLAYKLVTFYIKFLIIKLISFSSYVFVVHSYSLHWEMGGGAARNWISGFRDADGRGMNGNYIKVRPDRSGYYILSRILYLATRPTSG